MNRVSRLTNVAHPSPSTQGWNAFSTCTAMVIATAIGFATTAITSPASAQERRGASPTQQTDAPITEGQVRKRLDAAVANGSLTQDQADRRFRGWQERQQTTSQFPSKQSMDEVVVTEVKRGKLTEAQAADIMRVYGRLAMGLESGRLSVDEALAILDERSIAIYEGPQDQPSVTRQDYANAQTAMQKMVDAGDITKEQMNARLARMRKMIGQGQPTFTRKDYAEAQSSMQKMVDAGKITKEQMQQRLDRMKAAMTQQSKSKLTHKDYEEASAKMTEMVKAGKITREQMQQRLKQMKAAMAQQSKSKMTRKDYQEAAAKMTEMVKAGKMTREQMTEKLTSLRAAMATKSKSTLTGTDHDNAAAKMARMVKAGKMTREQMQQRLDRMKAEATQGDRAQRKEVPDDCMALGRRLRTAMEQGEMTSEEAKALWEAQGCP